MFFHHTLSLKQNSLIEKRARIRSRRKLMPHTVGWSVGIAGATLFIGIAYLLTLNAQSTLGYDLRRYESQKSALMQEIRTLDSRIGGLSSIMVIETAAQSMEFVAADDPRYFVPDTGVAAIDRIQP